MLERFIHDPLPYILGITAFLIFLGLLSRAIWNFVKFTHSLMDKIDYVTKEMKEDSGKSLKDYAVVNDVKMSRFEKTLDRMERKLQSIERRLPK